MWGVNVTSTLYGRHLRHTKRNLFTAKLPSTFYLVERGLNDIEDKVGRLKFGKIRYNADYKTLRICNRLFFTFVIPKSQES